MPRFRELEDRRRVLQQETEQLQSERNSKSKGIGQAKASGEDIAPLLAEVAELGDRLDAAKARFDTLQDELNEFLRAVPNAPDAAVPAGTDEEDNVELHRWGTLPEFNFEPKDHVDIAGNGAMDFEAASKISGSRFVVMHGQLARLHRSLTQFMVDTHVNEHGYEEIYVPYIVNADSLYGTGQLPKFAEDQFRVDQEQETYLIPTAEVPVTNVYRDEIIDADKLPIKHVCHYAVFSQRGRQLWARYARHDPPTSVREGRARAAGPTGRFLGSARGPPRSCGEHTEGVGAALSGGRSVRGRSRVLRRQDHRPRSLAARPGPVSRDLSCSNFLDFQARRMQARFRDPESGKPELVHTLNGSGLAVGRTLVALLENYQDGDGSVAIPDALRSYMGGADRLEFG